MTVLKRRAVDRRSFLKGVGTGLILCSWSIRIESDASQQTLPRRPTTTSESLQDGFRKQLFVDGFLVAESVGVSRELGSIIKEKEGQPLLVPDKPWEDPYAFGCFGSVLCEGNNFRLWYRPFTGGVAYAESSDGLRWHKPILELYDFDFDRIRKLGGFETTEKLKQPFSGKRSNLIGLLGDAWCCSLDEHESDPQHRFKAAHYPYPPITRPDDSSAALSHSPDGFHWTYYNNGRPVTGRACDTYNQIIWDGEARVYRLYTRQDYGDPGYRLLGDLREIRGSRSMTNPDVKSDPTNWTMVRKWRFDREGPDEHQRRQLMSMTNWIYSGVHFALMEVYEWPENFSEGPYDPYKRHERDIINLYVATCRGDDLWDLNWVYAGKPIIPRGPDGSFDKDWVWHISNIVTYKDRHWIYYTGSQERHWKPPWNLAIGVATLRLDGFASLQAKGAGGIVTTKPFRLEGNTLEVNVEAPKGELQCEVLDESSQPLPDFSGRNSPVYSSVDTVRLQPRWKRATNLSPLTGRTVRLKFNLSNAKLYAFQIRP